MSLVFGSEKDLESIVKINKKVFNSSKNPELIKKKLLLYNNPVIIIAEKNQKVRGYGIGYERKNKYYLWMLAVLPEYREKGVASGIIEKMMNYAKSKNYDYLTVKTRNKYKNMLRLLIKKGFRITGYKSREWDENPAIWLEYSLS